MKHAILTTVSYLNTISLDLIHIENCLVIEFFGFQVVKRLLNSAFPTHNSFIADFVQPIPDLYGNHEILRLSTPSMFQAPSG